ncbi:Dehydrogenase aclE [Colletotrichum orbiculare MAFF 240422]|uniref:Dehydrogenase aclE n=1 Tax=Colletotrichum orbiculare (strain 104-T / ATCC 96160 / CBS 514.97 / LARS 414 / MAFF 240422) TaxID=1213857 RepID=A0A484FGX1_COLOR|nr:Dehydrogenase aclE [Colletotrichum orbiculare MAFF 240422]
MVLPQDNSSSQAQHGRGAVRNSSSIAPIRVAVIGLASGDRTSWASNAHLPYLLSPRGRERYRIVALCNSSIDAAERAIKAYELPSETKAYGDPSELARDESVDLVVCSTRVDVHYKTILPSIYAGKDIYLEWPLAHDIDRSRELVEAARHSGSRTVVGIQGRVAPVHEKIRETLRKGVVGKVLSTEFRVVDGPATRDSLPLELKYFAQSAVGGNIYTIYFAHFWDQVQHVLGEVDQLSSRFQIQRPQVSIFDAASHDVVEKVISDVPDLITVSGSISANSDFAIPGATVSGRFRLGRPFPGEPRLVWSVVGEKGELRLTAGSSLLQAMGHDDPVVIEIHDFESDQVETIEWEWNEWQEDLPIVARSVGVLYEKFASGEAVPTFEDAIRRHEQLEILKFLADYKSQQQA